MIDVISRADAIERIANDNVVGGMKRINEYRDSTEHNDYLDGISTAIATVDDLPSAELPKGDLISRADVLKFPIRLNHYDEVNGSREFVYGVETVIEYIESLPSADAVQGEWIEVEDYNGDVHYKCDQCGEEWTFPFGTPKENNANYCPNCGARMTPYKGGDTE